MGNILFYFSETPARRGNGSDSEEQVRHQLDVQGQEALLPRLRDGVQAELPIPLHNCKHHALSHHLKRNRKIIYFSRL